MVRYSTQYSISHHIKQALVHTDVVYAIDGKRRLSDIRR